MKIFLFAILFGISSQAFGSKCLENRAVIKLGHVKTTLVIGKIDYCNITIKHFLLEKTISLNFFHNLKKTNNVITPMLQNRAIGELKKLVDLAKKYNPRGIILLPSSNFKATKNYMDFFKRIKEDLRVKFFLPDLKTDAELGFLGVKIKFPETSSKILVWDISSNGSSWTTLDNDLNFKVYTEKMNPLIFKKMVIEGILKKDHKKVLTPNPLGPKKADEALELIKFYANYNIPEIIKKKAKDFKIVGIGGFHNDLIKGLVGARTPTYDLPQLKAKLEKYANLNDEQIGGDFKEYIVTGLILAIGLLETLGVDKVTTSTTSEAHGALMYPKFWKIATK
jgi:exopolyphosphatase/guanosine-5'-triphosphate,3'-diphosphate pyrophosphatase